MDESVDIVLGDSFSYAFSTLDIDVFDVKVPIPVRKQVST